MSSRYVSACGIVIGLCAQLLTSVTAPGQPLPPQSPERVHGIAMHGTPALPPGFTHLPYVNPDAPKGGLIRLGALGSFDSLNPFVFKGVPAPGLREYVFESLLARSADEPFSLYGLVAESIEVAPDYGSATFVLRSDARFSDGRPIGSADVIASHRLLSTKGFPYHRSFYAKVARVEPAGETAVRFVFKGPPDRELPLIIGLMPILPAHHYTDETFERASLDLPVGSGPYVVDRIAEGRTISYRANPGWWGRDLPINRGRFNFDEIRYEFYRDATALSGALTAGQIDVRVAEDPARWVQSHALASGIVRRELPLAVPAGMSGLVFNTRRPPFDDHRVRRALIEMFDGAGINQTLFHGLYRRADSYFSRSELAAAGRPADDRERALLADFPDAVRPEIMAGAAPSWARHDGPHRDGEERARLAAGVALLRESGYRISGSTLVHESTGRPFAFEFLARSRPQERLILTFAERLAKVGIRVRVRQVDSAQYWARLRDFDFDMIQWTWSASLSPGNEQLNRWSTASADTVGSLNYPGVKSPAADRAIDAMLQADSREALVSAVRALDRVLMAGDYVIPLYYAPGQWLAYRDRFAMPERIPLTGVDYDLWWLKP